jgi:hypothetical protein
MTLSFFLCKADVQERDCSGGQRDFHLFQTGFDRGV